MTVHLTKHCGVSEMHPHFPRQVNWQYEDPESGIAAQHLVVGQRLGGQTKWVLWAHGDRLSACTRDFV